VDGVVDDVGDEVVVDETVEDDDILLLPSDEHQRQTGGSTGDEYRDQSRVPDSSVDKENR
jgi:hypothetical protein